VCRFRKNNEGLEKRGGSFETKPFALLFAKNESFSCVHYHPHSIPQYAKTVQIFCPFTSSPLDSNNSKNLDLLEAVKPAQKPFAFSE
jgi:hypothetical protein